MRKTIPASLSTYSRFPSHDRTMRIRWAGDVDGDGKLDLVTEENVEGTVVLHLFLSSAARAGALVGEAAQLSYGGC